ncbi:MULTISPECIES: AcaB family transcriptional regulator [Pasteurellaceae]|uniref:AcaB family transcriptional regulator n=1 Tax=Pasteurella atlantica TaxID=2827233 RepID=A0AAW8CL88_9PAST|nr:AcaB family transcriptional regulator [Pasteurella atlantica]MBR0573821.1 DUF1845 family protein [Pasteurella atlantica]MDP8039757.1 AcaB family transcriptional regulator [Pasteurella atlantica]MDP8041942.1 AcaB family transcriptional regulator [Pasteurella atlantica]MDP8044033.1 AcaB family transcriptional regulator [Pasteurella atlantica]MDP8046011.1 AcaB family transcriptional regulator [Pasteurella atlantica]
MVLGSDQLKKINDAKQSIEVSEEMKSISDDEVKLTVQEEQYIIDSTETEQDAQMVREAAILAKKKKIATQKAKARINRSVPAEKLFHRPSYGYISATATYHTRDAYRFLLGRNPRTIVRNNQKVRQTRIVGLFEAANAVKNIEAGYQQGCYYATWTLVKIERQMQKIRELFAISQEQTNTMIKNATNLVFEPFSSRSPTTVTLDFRSSYAFHFSDLLTQYDILLRSVLSYRLHSIVSSEDYRLVELKMGTPLRELFHLTDTWEFVGREVVDEKNARLQDIEHRLGVLPDEILSGKLQPTIARVSNISLGGKSDE